MDEQLAQEGRLYFESFYAARVSLSLSLSISRGLLLWLLSLKAVVRDSHCELDEGVETNWKQKKKKKKRERCAFYGSELPMRMIRHKWCFPKAPSRRIQRGARDGGVFSFILDISASFRCFFLFPAWKGNRSSKSTNFVLFKAKGIFLSLLKYRLSCRCHHHHHHLCNVDWVIGVDENDVAYLIQAA